MRSSTRLAIAFAVVMTITLGAASLVSAQAYTPGDEVPKPVVGSVTRDPSLFATTSEEAGWNNNIGNAHIFARGGGRFFDSNIGATLQTDWAGRQEPVVVTEHGPNAGGASIWYKWTPARSGTAVINTFGSSWDAGSRVALDTILGVFRGQQLRQLQQVVGNDDANARGGHQGYTSRVRFHVVGGRTYHIVVDGYNWPVTASNPGGVNPYSTLPGWRGDPAGTGPEMGLVRILARLV